MTARVRKALILAAGRGSWMMSLTVDKPKCLVMLNDTPLLQYSLEALQQNGITHVCLVVGYHGEKIKAFVAKQFPQLHVDYIANRDWQYTNSLASMFLGLSSYNRFEPYLLLESDLVYHAELLSKLISSKTIMSTLLHPHDESLSGSFAHVGKTHLTSWVHETRRESEFLLHLSYKTVNITYVNSLQPHQQLLQAARDTLESYGIRSPLEYAMQLLIERGTSITPIYTDGHRWAELDTPQELVHFSSEFQKV